MEELRICPHCGNKEVELEEDERGWRAVCYKCGIGRVEHNWTRQYAIDSWNGNIKK